VNKEEVGGHRQPGANRKKRKKPMSHLYSTKDLSGEKRDAEKVKGKGKG